ncbi:putative Interferon regulatory factor 8-like, partial [Homarus americanus]
KTIMTPAAITDAPMDLSMKTRRKLRLEEFLRQNLDQAPAGRVNQPAFLSRAKTKPKNGTQ